MSLKNGNETILHGIIERLLRQGFPLLETLSEVYMAMNKGVKISPKRLRNIRKAIEEMNTLGESLP